uniref:Leucine rich repeat containing 3 n=1 Tax=Sphaeramia orbicularis TaxID=375764 RepID=A0A673BF96_9TELE
MNMQDLAWPRTALLSDGFALLCGLLCGICLASFPASACPTSCPCMSRNLDRVPPDLPRDTVFLLLASNHITHVPNHAFRDCTTFRSWTCPTMTLKRWTAGRSRGFPTACLSWTCPTTHPKRPQGGVRHLRAKISLSNNPWHCECTLQEVLRELRLDPETVNGWSATAPYHRVAMFVTMFGWFTMVIAYVIYYVRHNQEDARRHLEYLKSLSTTCPLSDLFVNIFTVIGRKTSFFII